jgi:hypothetical protein
MFRNLIIVFTLWIIHMEGKWKFVENKGDSEIRRYEEEV